jgi:hypothetical protein
MTAAAPIPPPVKGRLQEGRRFSFRSRIEGKFCEYRAKGLLIDITFSEPGAEPIRAHRLLLANSSTFFQSLCRQLPSPPPRCLDPRIPFDCKSNFATLIDFFYERAFKFSEGAYEHYWAFHVLAGFPAVDDILSFTTDLLRTIPKPSDTF